MLAKKFDVNLMKNQVVDTIFAPLLKLDRLQYVNLPPIDVSMYLECLALLSTLMERKFLKHDANLFQMVNVQFLVAMSIKHGNTGKTHFLASFLSFRTRQLQFFGNIFRSMCLGAVPDE